MAIGVDVRVTAQTAQAEAGLKRVGTAATEASATATKAAGTTSSALAKTGQAAKQAASGASSLGTAFGSFAGGAISGALTDAIAGFTGLDVSVVQAGLSFAATAAQAAIANAEFLLTTVRVNAAAAATVAWAAIQRVAAVASIALGAALDFMLGPIGLVIIGVVAVIAIFVLLYTRVSWFRAAVNAVIGAWVQFTQLQFAIIAALVRGVIAVFGTIAGAIRGALAPIANIIIAPYRLAFSLVSSGVSALWDWAPRVVGAIASGISGVYNAIVEPFRAAWDFVQNYVVGPIRSVWNGIAGAINGFSFTLPAVHIPGTSITIGGQTIGFPHFPAAPFARGGVVTRPTLALIGEAGQREIVAPEPLLRSMIGGSRAAVADVRIEFHQHVDAPANPAEVGRQSVRMLQAYVRANGAGSLRRALGI